MKSIQGKHIVASIFRKKRIQATHLLCALLVFGSCTRDNFLDFEPRGIVIPSTVEDYRLMLDNIEDSQSTVEQASLINIHFEPYYITDDTQFTPAIAQSLNFGLSTIAAYTFQENIYLSNQEDPEWRSYFSQIYTCNIIVDGLTKLDLGDESEKNQLIAEAKLHRAFAYFNLVNIYCVHYNPETAATDLGLPLRLGTELEGVDLTRVSVEEIYTFIIDEILESYISLPDTVDLKINFRPSKAGAAGLLAKVYLYQAKYDLALEQAEYRIRILQYYS